MTIAELSTALDLAARHINQATSCAIAAETSKGCIPTFMERNRPDEDGRVLGWNQYPYHQFCPSCRAYWHVLAAINDLDTYHRYNDEDG